MTENVLLIEENYNEEQMKVCKPEISEFMVEFKQKLSAAYRPHDTFMKNIIFSFKFQLVSGVSKGPGVMG